MTNKCTVSELLYSYTDTRLQALSNKLNDLLCEAALLHTHF